MAQWEKTGSRKETKLTEACASRHQQPPADVLTISPMAPLGPAPNNWVNNLHRLLNAHVLMSWPATLITDKAKSTHECGQLDRAVRTHQFKTVSNFCRGKPEARRKRKRLLNSSFKPGPRVPSSPLHRGQCRPPSNRPWGVGVGVGGGGGSAICPKHGIPRVSSLVSCPAVALRPLPTEPR